jgi:predicted enzyme related to lactoylglutathione lyase
MMIFTAIVIILGASFGERGADMDRQEKGIDYIELAAIDIVEAKRFYGEVFGWTFVDFGPDYASFNDGRLDGGFRTEQAVRRGGPLIVLYALDLEAVKESVASAGGAIVQDIFEFPGGRRFHFTDPSGNELAVWSDK